MHNEELQFANISSDPCSNTTKSSIGKDCQVENSYIASLFDMVLFTHQLVKSEVLLKCE